jgi:hypothetical protein
MGKECEFHGELSHYNLPLSNGVSDGVKGLVRRYNKDNDDKEK